jgi:hypothetical protein
MEPLRRWLVIVLSGACVAATALPVRAQGPTRANLIDAFYDLREQTKKAYKDSFETVIITKSKGDSVPLRVMNQQGRSGITKFKGVDVPASGGNAKLILKVWAVPLADGREIGKKVHLSKYAWRPKERMHLYFETSTPVYLGFYQDAVDSGGKLTARTKVLPAPAFTQSYKVIEPNQKFRFPVTIELDDDLQDEIMSIVFVTAGDPDLPIPNTTTTTTTPTKNNKLAEEEFLVFGRSYDAKFDKKAEKVFRLTKFRATTDDGDPGSMTSSTGDPDDVAIIAYGNEQSGHVQIRLHKRKN